MLKNSNKLELIVSIRNGIWYEHYSCYDLCNYSSDNLIILLFEYLCQISAILLPQIALIQQFLIALFFHFSALCGISFFFCFLWMDASKSYTGREWEFQIFAFYCFCSSNKTKKIHFKNYVIYFFLNVLKIWSDTHRL